jgi:GT2 family glycosyltransferase
VLFGRRFSTLPAAIVGAKKMEEARFKVSIIIPNYNRRECLGRLLPSIANQTFEDYEVIIIDDFSPDKSVLEYINTFIKDYENMRLIENNENMGFVRTCNKGIKLASGDYICLLNNDTEVKSNFVERNVEIMDADSSIGVLSCVIVDQDGNNWFSGGSLKAGINLNLRDDFEGVRSVDFVAGTACFYRREVFDKIGLLSEYLVMYYEDVEFCLRVRRETNYRVCMFSEKLVTHHVRIGTVTSNRACYYMHRNHILILKKYFPESIPRVFVYYLKEIANLVLVSLLRLDPSYSLLTPHIVRGTIDGLVKRQGE